MKAGVECVGIDAATGREIPRSYVDWLEKRVKHLELELKLKQPNEDDDNAIDPQLHSGWSDNGRQNDVKRGSFSGSISTAIGDAESVRDHHTPRDDRNDSSNGECKALHLRPDIENLVNQVGLVGVQGTSAPGFMGGSSGISFARLMFAAVKLSVKDGDKTGNSPPGPAIPTSDSIATSDPAASSTVIPRNRQRTAPCPFPNRDVAEQLLEIYFQQANPQFPILFRPTFKPIFRRLCDRVEMEGGTPPANFVQHGMNNFDSIQHSADLYFAFMCFAIASAMSQSTENLPERYHAAAMQHVDSLFLSAASTNNRLDGLKGVLLLALYSLMRPCNPGVWYVLGSALRLAVDMGLHQENTPKAEKTWDPVALDERRRLFWCTYSFDRQVSVYLGRPFGISDDAVKVPFPVDVDDECITPNGILPQQLGRMSSRTISLHMFRIRQLQSEIQQILYQNSEIPRRFSSLENWRRDMEARLQHWCDTAPKNRDEAGCGFNLSFVDLNYQQTRLLLYGLCPAVPSPSTEAFEIIADSGSKIIKAYRHLHREKSINYTWLACHNLFMAGTSYLCALWQCPEVRAATTIDQIDFHTLACVDVLSSMIERCPAAQTCRDVFDSLASSTVQLCSSEMAAMRPRSQASNRGSHQVHHQEQQQQRSAKRFRPETSQADWVPSEYSHSPPTPSQIPASLANLLHHPPPPPQDQYMHRQQSYEPMVYPHQQDLDPMFRMAAQLPDHLIGEVEMSAGMDGSRLFEMIREVGSSGGVNFAYGLDAGWPLEAWTGAATGQML